MLKTREEKNTLKDKKGITLIALVITIIVLLILAGVSIMTLTGDNGLLTRTVGAKNKTTLAGMEEELNLAYMSVYTGKAGSGAINSGVSLDEIYNDASLPSEVKSHIIQIGNANTIRLRDGSQSSVTILAEDGAITSNGTAGTNTVNIEIEEVSNSNVYWLESEGVYYPMSIANGKVVLDKENTRTTAPTGAGNTGNEIGITFLDNGAAEAGETSNYVTKNSSKSGNITTITLTASNAGSTQLIVKKGNGTEAGERVEVGVTVTPIYTLQFGAMTNGDIVITTGGQERAKNTKYASGTQIVLTAKGDTGYAFDKWYDNGTENSSVATASRNVTVNAETAAVTYTATFVKPVAYFKQEGTKAYYYPADGTERIEITNNPADSLATNPTGKKEYVGRYLGMEVEYTPYQKFSDRGTSSTYRLFYIDLDAGTNNKGKYGDGQGTIYLKADQDSGKTATLDSIDTTNKTDVNVMAAYNPKWNASYSGSTYDNVTYVKYLLDKGIWRGYTDTGNLSTAEIANYAVGAPSLEMWIDSYNAFLRANPVSGKKEYNCTVTQDTTTILTGSTKKGPVGTNSGKGYYVGTKEQVSTNTVEAYYNGTNSDGYYTATDSLAKGSDYSTDEIKDRLKAWNPETSYYWLASPSAHYSYRVMIVSGNSSFVSNNSYNDGLAFCPLVSIKSGVSIQEK